MQVIDGMHRVRAAILSGAGYIEALLFEGAEDEAFLLAVQLNVAHGLPLSRADRVAAAVRIIHSSPQWSDRAIARAAGLSDKTVASIRRRTSAEIPHLSVGGSTPPSCPRVPPRARWPGLTTAGWSG